MMLRLIRLAQQIALENSVWYPIVFFFSPSNFHNNLLIEIDVALFLCGCSLLLLLMVPGNWPELMSAVLVYFFQFTLEMCLEQSLCLLGFNRPCLHVSSSCNWKVGRNHGTDEAHTDVEAFQTPYSIHFEITLLKTKGDQLLENAYLTQETWKTVNRYFRNRFV